MGAVAQRNLRALLAATRWRETLVVTRTIVSQSLEIKEAWQERLKAPVFQKINMGKLGQDKDQSDLTDSI